VSALRDVHERAVEKALAATWDTALARTAGRLLGQEARRKGVHLLLAPTVNMQRIPLQRRAGQVWDGGWRTAPGGYTVEAAHSTADRRASIRIDV
jgi:hypothetical protein